MLSRRFCATLAFLASGCFIDFQVFNQASIVQAQNSEATYIVQSAEWTGDPGTYPNGDSACASFAGRGRFKNETLYDVQFNPGFSSATCVMEGRLRNGDPYYLNAVSFARCPTFYEYVGDASEGICVQESALNQEGIFPIEDELPDYSACSYYDEIAQTEGCRYHSFGAKVCREESISVNALVAACGIPESKLNCIRSCLVEADKIARQTPACQINCSDTTCTNTDCIDTYHKLCFQGCEVSSFCYGGRY